MITLEVQQLSKQYAAGMPAPAVNCLSFALHQGEILALVGPSGCGKTTTLRLIAGLERPDAGSVVLNGRLVAGQGVFVPPEKRGVGLVFQDHALFPHLDVAANIAFGLRGLPAAEQRQRSAEMLRLVGLEGLAGRYPHQLSGGERQRVALARALAPSPVLVLMDEPFSSLDADLRGAVREQVRAILKAMHATVIFVTHDQEEALFMGDRLAVFQAGQLEQIGSPEQIYFASATRFVAEFMGSSDFIPGVVTPDGIHTPLGMLCQPVSMPAGSALEIALRADDVDFSLEGRANALIVERFFRGALNVYRLRLDSGERLHAFKAHTELVAPGTRVSAFICAGHPLSIFPLV